MGKGKIPLIPFGSRDFSLSHNAMLTGVKIQPEIRPNFSGSHNMETSFSWIFLRCPSLHSKRFRVIQGTRVRDRAKHRASKRAGRGWFLRWFLRWLSFSLSFHFLRGQNRKSRSSVFFYSGTKRKHGKRLLHRLEMPVYKRSPFILSCRILKSCRSTHDVTEPLRGLWKLQNVWAVNKQVNKSWPWTALNKLNEL